MTPERLKDLITYFKQVPIVEQEYAMECITEIQRLQAALPTPAKEPSSEYVKAVEALELALCHMSPLQPTIRKTLQEALAALKPLLAAPTADEARERPKCKGHGLDEPRFYDPCGLCGARPIDEDCSLDPNKRHWIAYATSLESRLTKSTGKPAPLLAGIQEGEK